MTRVRICDAEGCGKRIEGHAWVAGPDIGPVLDFCSLRCIELWAKRSAGIIEGGS